ncbi:MAG: accessory factor UbiK family protein [Betaproteobacteria bacterium]|nr:accessory factor UbiK family protein [Betaproteobacteria bacterium]
MPTPRILDDLSARLSELLATSPARDIEKNARALMGSVFSRLDLVTREEFDVQSELLARTRARLEALEARVAQLERQLAGGDDATPVEPD